MVSQETVVFFFFLAFKTHKYRSGGDEKAGTAKQRSAEPLPSAGELVPP